MDGTEAMAWLLPAALALLLAGLGGEHARRVSAHQRRRGLLGLTVTCLLAGGLSLLALSSSWQVGIAVWLGLLGVAGFVVSLGVSLYQHGWRQRATHRRDASAASPRDARHSITKTIFFLLFAATSALAIMLALTLILPLAATDRALLSVVVWPVLWAGLSLFLLATTRPLRALLGIAVSTLLLGAGGIWRWMA